MHMIKIFLYNAHFVYNKSKSKEEQLTYLEFLEKMVESFVEPRKRVKGSRPCANFHYLMKLPATEKKVVMRSCMKCYKDGIRHKSSFMCDFVQTSQSCVNPCFRNYHLELGFGEGFYEDKEDYDISEKGHYCRHICIFYCITCDVLRTYFIVKLVSSFFCCFYLCKLLSLNYCL